MYILNLAAAKEVQDSDFTCECKIEGKRNVTNKILLSPYHLK